MYSTVFRSAHTTEKTALEIDEMEVAIMAALAVGEGEGEANARDGKCGLLEILDQAHFHPLLVVPRQTYM
jgi:hypothetical protein